MIVKIKGHSSLSGRPEVIVSLMAEASFYDDKSGADYIESVVHTTWRCFGIPLRVTGTTYAERAESLLRELAQNDMIKIEED